MIDITRQSPNHSPRTNPVLGLVVHATGGGWRSALFWLTTRISRVSAHYLIRADGYTWQLVPEDRAAWHAGRSAWPGLPQVNGSLNDCTVGIEMENRNTGRDPYPAVQVEAAIALSHAIVARYGIARQNLVRHLDISPGRKTDPAGLDWAMFVAAVYGTVPLPPLVPPPPPTPAIVTYRAVAYAFIRAAPTTASNRIGSVQKLAPVNVLRIVAGKRLSNRLGTSDQWAERAEGGYVWLPQLEAL